MIEIKNITYEYEDVPIFKDFNLSIKNGDFYMILGENGSGKSTLVKLITGIELPKEGKILVDNLDSSTDDIWKIREILGVIFQNPEDQFVGLTPYEDMTFLLENYGIKEKEVRIDKALKSVGLLEKKFESIENFSGGQKQKLALATSLLLEPKVLVLDESTSMLDPRSREELLELLKVLNKKGVTIIYITHFLEEIIYSSHCLLLDKGKIIIEGKYEDIIGYGDKLEEYRLVLPPHFKLINKLNRSNKLNKKYDFKDKKSVVEEICRSL